MPAVTKTILVALAATALVAAPVAASSDFLNANADARADASLAAEADTGFLVGVKDAAVGLYSTLESEVRGLLGFATQTSIEARASAEAEARATADAAAQARADAESEVHGLVDGVRGEVDGLRSSVSADLSVNAASNAQGGSSGASASGHGAADLGLRLG